jgi:N-acetylglucosamine-6-phosphate deacetylase
MIREADSNFRIKAIDYGTGNPVSVEISNGNIERIDEAEGLSDCNLFIAPGLIDNQINGYAGVDFSSDSLKEADILKAAQAIWRDGVTSFFPTLITNSNERLLKNFRILSAAVNGNSVLRDSIPGFHLEGPYISPVEGYRGCHPEKYIRKPSWEEFSAYQKAAGGNIREITLAPEIEGTMAFIKKCTQEGVITALGHTDATAEQVLEAVRCGARLSTHLGNGAANFIHRHNNPIWPQLANDLLTPTIIADGHHLLPEEIQVFYKVKGPQNLILTSDVMFLAGMAPGKYNFLDSEVILTDDGLLYNPLLNCLAGASFPLKKGVENIMNFTGCSLTNAINMASRNVADVFDLNDRGRLLSGMRADLILFERDGNRMIIRKTWIKGKLVFSEEQ